MSNNKQSQGSDMKKVVEQLVTNLKRNGVKVTSAAVLNLETQANQNAVDKAVNNIMTKVNSLKPAPMPPLPTTPGLPPLPPMPNIKQEGTEIRKCMCPNCFNFDSFEERLGEPGSIFDYTTFTLNNIEFEVKYHLSPSGEENVMAAKKDRDNGKVDYSTMSVEQLEVELSKAVQNKEFQKSQLLLNAIQQLRNQNKNQ